MRLPLLILALFVASAAGASDYTLAVKDKSLVEGLGFEGALTVYDETPRLYRNLGQPVKRPDFPLWYFYNTGSFHVTVRAEYTDGRFLIRSIQLSGKSDGAPRTNQGIRLGDPLSRLHESHGPAEVIDGADHTYPSRGVTFHMDTNSSIVGITVYRPVRGARAKPQPRGPDLKLPVAPTAARLLVVARVAADETSRPQSAPVGAVLAAPAEDHALAVYTPTALDGDGGLARLGIALAIPGTWRQEKLIAQWRSLDLRGSVGVVACQECAGTLGDRIRAFEKTQPQNLIDEALRNVGHASLSRMGAESAYLGRYETADKATWLVALRRADRGWLVKLEVDRRTPLDQEAMGAIATLLKSVKLLTP